VGGRAMPGRSRTARDRWSRARRGFRREVPHAGIARPCAPQPRRATQTVAGGTL